jgi:hypothetical protein
LIRLKDKTRTELVVARDRVKILKDFLGMWMFFYFDLCPVNAKLHGVN